MIPPTDRETMNKKPVLYREAKTVLTLPSLEFQKKLLCDGITLNLGDACAYSCEFCYVGAAMTKIDKPLLDLHNGRNDLALRFSDVVIRRRNPIELLRGQLLKADGSAVHANRRDQRVVYSSTLVDVAANMALLRETAEACNLILEHTHWQIRLLSKSNLLHKLVEALHDIHTYKGGILWRNGYPTFETYCRARWDYGKSHAYRLVECGSFIQELEATQSPIGDWPRTESQIRPLLTLPKEDRMACWQEILAGNSTGDITAKTVKAATLARLPPKVGRLRPGKAQKSLLLLRDIIESHSNHGKIAELLSQIERLLDQN